MKRKCIGWAIFNFTAALLVSTCSPAFADDLSISVNATACGGGKIPIMDGNSNVIDCYDPNIGGGGGGGGLLPSPPPDDGGGYIDVGMNTYNASDPRTNCSDITEVRLGAAVSIAGAVAVNNLNKIKQGDQLAITLSDGNTDTWTYNCATSSPYCRGTAMIGPD